MADSMTKPYRSVSQHNTYVQCPQRYKLERIDKVWQRPAAWLSQGTAVHTALEAWERSGRTMPLEAVQDVFRDEYAASIEEQAEVTPNTEYWFASGPYRGAVDIERRYGIGLEQCEKLMAWYDKHPEETVWITPDGTPAIELGYEVEIGGVPVRGFIDVIMSTPAGLVVRDIKTGNMPGDEFQLATYALAMKIMYDVEITTGDYFMGRTGKPTVPYDLTDELPLVPGKYKDMNAKVEAGEFPAKPDPKKCGFCGVRTSCAFAEL